MLNNLNKTLLVFVAFVSFFVFTPQAKAESPDILCTNRYLTLINPVRDRSLWADNSLSPLRQQYSEINKYSFAATWLLQYDTFDDQELVNEIKSFDAKQEDGIFLEISRKLAADAGVAYPIYVRWSDPGAVFLSAYSQSERRKLIDQMFTRFKTVYGKYPKSVGAWWIDSYSLNYMTKRYGIKSVLIVADQKVTDSYGVWGQWWGFPYKPSKANILVPASNSKNSEDVVVLQWAQRDPVLAYGGVGQFSRYSLQANDYVIVNKDINYFKQLTSQYLDCRNPLGQITVGLETGMESLRNPEEYERQLKYLSEVPDLNVVTMVEFADSYFQVYDVNPNKISFGDEDASWEMTADYRKNEKLGENINYKQSIAFKDYFIKDSSDFLDRVMPVDGFSKTLIPWYLLTLAVLVFISLRFGLFRVWISSTLVLLAGYGLILRSTYKFGWEVFYGPQVQNLPLSQSLTVLVIFALVAIINKLFKNKFNLWLLPLSFGLDRIVSLLRYTSIEGVKYFGVILGKMSILGFRLSKESLTFSLQRFEPIQFHSLIKFNFSEIWQNNLLYFVVYPISHFILAFVLWKLLAKLPTRIKSLLLIILVILFMWQIQFIFTSDPISVVPIIQR